MLPGSFDFQSRSTTPTPPGGLPTIIPNDLKEQANQYGLLVTEELDIAVQRCKTKVEKIAAECRRGNRKYRDIEFDFIEDQDLCLYGLDRSGDQSYTPSDVLRVNQIFNNPKFFVDGATAGDVAQGALGDCWFISAIAVVASAGLIEKICVARDEQVGVYGFIFWRDSGWVDVIIDDLLFTKTPRFEELSAYDQSLYHGDRDQYNKTARKGSKTLYFARSRTDDETWVPLLEKAYAKLHGDYASLSGGYTRQAVEDLTGSVSTLIHVQDILDTDRFWEEELMRDKGDRLFACFTRYYDNCAVAPVINPVDGLVRNHVYSIIKAAECKGKRFLRVRNPWGEDEWKGRWSDGSKEWTREWLQALEVLDYNFGDDGEFIMEYSDFLSVWGLVEKSHIFDESWVLSSLWLKVDAGEFPGTWSVGDVSYQISIPKATSAIIVLAQIDTRYFEELSGCYEWSLDFTLSKKGEADIIGSSFHSSLYDRSVKLEIELEEGDYVVHVRLDRADKRSKTFVADNSSGWVARKYTRKLIEYAQSQSIAANFKPASAKYLPVPSEMYPGKTITDIEIEAQAQIEAKRTARKAAFAPPPEKTEAEKNPEGVKSKDFAAQQPEIVAESPIKAVSESSDIVIVEKEGTTESTPAKVEDTTSTSKPQVASDETPKPAPVELSETPTDSSVESKPQDDKKEPDGVKDQDANKKEESEKEKKEETKEKKDDDKKDEQKKDEVKNDEDKKDGAKEDKKDSSPSADAKPIEIVKLPDPPKIHGGWSCDGCEGPIEGYMYYCTHATCSHFSYCEKCVKLDLHDKAHSFMKLELAEDSQRVLEGSGVDYNSVVVGLRVYTDRSSPATITGQLRHGNIIRHAVTGPKYL